MSTDAHRAAIQGHFEGEAAGYDQIIRALIPHYAQMLAATVQGIPLQTSVTIRVLDLGCGTGAVTEAVLARFPAAHVICVDAAAPMMALARQRLGAHPNVAFRLDDFSTMAMEGPFDVVVSSLALHHLATDVDKRAFYGRLLHALSPGGVFINADIILGASDALQDVYMRQWCAFMERTVDKQQILDTWLPRYYAEDRPARLVDQLQWLIDLGFQDVDVVWKYYNFAVYGGRRRQP